MQKDDVMLYLREDVYFEPLFNGWYAWSYLLQPATGARHMVHTHRRIMKSFINNFQLHQMALNAPGMAGGEFMDCSEGEIPKIREMVEDIEKNHGDLIELSDAIARLEEILAAHTTGESLEKLYADVPDALQGYVELIFDSKHNASYRFIEGLLYKSDYYKPQLQTVSFGLLNRVKERSFVLSTPRLADDDHIQLNIRFDDPVLDKIFSARQNPISEAEIEQLFSPYEKSGGLNYRELFTEEAPKYHHQPVEEGLRTQYLGHAGFLLETPDVAILIDPVIASRGEDYADEVISFNQLPSKVDYICITHNHQDHFNYESLLQLRHKTKKVVVPKNNGGTLVDPSMKLLLKQLKFDVIEVDDMEEIDLPGGKILSIPFLGEHGDLNIRSKAAWMLELADKRLVFAADSSNLAPVMYEHIAKIIGTVDILAIGMECVGAPYTWIYGALNTVKVSKKIKDSRRLNGSDCHQAGQIIEALKPGEVYIYALGLEPWYKYFMGVDYDDDSEQKVQSAQLIELCKGDDLEADVKKAEILYGKKDIEFA